MKDNFQTLGQRHVAFQCRGFKPEYWETFTECMTQTVVEWEGHRGRQVCGIWRALVGVADFEKAQVESLNLLTISDLTDDFAHATRIRQRKRRTVGGASG